MPQGIGSSVGGSAVGLDHPGSRSQESPAFEGAEKVDRWMDNETDHQGRTTLGPTERLSRVPAG